MKVDIIDEDNTIVYLNKMIVRFIDFSNIKDSIDVLIKKLNIRGCLNINIYDSNKYSVIEINREEIDYFDSCNINYKKENFIYEIDLIPEIHQYIFYNNKFYVEKEKVEFTKIIYGNEKDLIKKFGKKINI